jgi:hypothetical protein
MNTPSEISNFLNVFEQRSLLNFLKSPKIPWHFEQTDVLTSCLFEKNKQDFDNKKYDFDLLNIFQYKLKNINKISSYIILPNLQENFLYIKKDKYDLLLLYVSTNKMIKCEDECNIKLTGRNVNFILKVDYGK